VRRTRALEAWALGLALWPAAAGAGGSTYYVSPSGNDANPCSLALPCREIRQPLTFVGAGDTILVADGSYLGFDVFDIHGAPGAPVTIQAQGTGAVVLVTTDRPDNRDTIFITFSSYIVVDGLRAFTANRAAVRVDQSPSVTVRNGVFGDNTTWGIFTDFSDDLLLEGNECYGSVEEHGIYVSNSGDRPVVRANRVHDNNASGIQLNADLSAGGDGIITDATIENNVIHGNGVAGGAAINLDGVQDSVVRNNLLYDNHATGIVNYMGDGAEGPRGMRILHNTVDQAPDARWGLLIWNTTGPNFVRNNILYNRNPNRGGITYLDPVVDVANTDSDHNIMDLVTPDDGQTVYTLAEWQALGHEPHSLSVPLASLFVDPDGGDYHLAAASPAIDAGQTLAEVPVDIEGNPRPAGPASDIGAYESPAPASISVSDCAVVEGDAGSVPCPFAVSLSGPSPLTVTVSFATADGTATAGSDYTPANGTVTFPPGTTSQPLPVAVLGDVLVEPDETLAVNLSSPVNGTIADGQGVGTIGDDDTGPLSSHELAHGAVHHGDLAVKPDLYRIGQRPYSSYEVVIDGTSGDIVPVALARLAGDLSVLQTALPVGVGDSVSLRWENTTALTVVNQHLRVDGSCATPCAGDDVYRVRAFETTYSVPRFNNAGSQITVLIVQNPTAAAVNGHAWFWSVPGALLGSHSFSLAARGTLVLNTTTVPGVAGQGGTITLSHDARYGDLAGKTVALEPSTGFSFDSPMSPRPR
jgi:parallel beta-helix repeat protein